MPKPAIHLGTSPTQKNDLWKLRVPPELAVLVELEAQRRGMCRSDFVRLALFNALGKAA